MIGDLNAQPHRARKGVDLIVHCGEVRGRLPVRDSSGAVTAVRVIFKDPSLKR